MPIPSADSGFDRTSAAQQIYNTLKEWIVDGTLMPGEFISDSEIAKYFSVSRTPVREAFQALEAEGLIELRMNKGAIVKPIDEKYITDHYEMRILLESEAAARAAKNGMPDADPLIEKLMDIQKRMESLSTSEYENLNFDVHSSIWTAADNMRLYKMLANLWNGPSIGFTSPKLEHYIKSTQEHIDILTAIRNHDAKKARKEMEQHTERSMNNILKSFKFR